MDSTLTDRDARIGEARAAAWLRVLPAAGPPAETYVRRPRGTRAR